MHKLCNVPLPPLIGSLKAHLQDRLKKNNKGWKWSEKETQAFKDIKRICQKLPMIIMPKKGDKLIVTTDASEDAWSAVLCFMPQVGPSQWDSQERVTRHANGIWNRTERNWSTFDKELRAIRLALTKFICFVKF